VEVVASLSQGRTAAAQCGLFTHKSVPVIFEPPCTIFFITVNALRVSGGFSAHHQELKNCTHSIGYMSSLLAATASGGSKQARHIPDAVCTVLELLIMGGKPA